jgi:hypothetical protein
MVHQPQYQCLWQEHGSQRGRLVYTCLLRFVQQTLNYPQILFLGVRGRSVQLFETALQKGSSENRDAVDKLRGKVVEEKTNELKGKLGHLEIRAAKHDSHKFLHTCQLVRIGSDGQYLLALLTV